MTSSFRANDTTGSTPNGHLYRIADLYPNYKDEIFDGKDIKGYSVYSNNDEKIGAVYDILVDRNGRFRYYVVNTGFLGIGKKILLPVGRASLDRSSDRIYVQGLSKDQAKNLPEYDDGMVVDYEYEEQVRNNYTTAGNITTGGTVTTPTTPTYSRENYTYENHPDLYNIGNDNNQHLRLYEERLVANKDRFRTGVVTVGKKVETDNARVSVPVEKERVIIERTNATNTTPVEGDATAFQEGEIARMELYEEKANVQKQTFVREEVNVKKQVERDTVNVEDTVRREELDVRVDDKPVSTDRPISNA